MWLFKVNINWGCDEFLIYLKKTKILVVYWKISWHILIMIKEVPVQNMLLWGAA